MKCKVGALLKRERTFWLKSSSQHSGLPRDGVTENHPEACKFAYASRRAIHPTNKQPAREGETLSDALH